MSAHQRSILAIVNEKYEDFTRVFNGFLALFDFLNGKNDALGILISTKQTIFITHFHRGHWRSFCSPHFFPHHSLPGIAKNQRK